MWNQSCNNFPPCFCHACVSTSACLFEEPARWRWHEQRFDWSRLQRAFLRIALPHSWYPPGEEWGGACMYICLYKPTHPTFSRMEEGGGSRLHTDVWKYVHRKHSMQCICRDMHVACSYTLLCAAYVCPNSVWTDLAHVRDKGRKTCIGPNVQQTVLINGQPDVAGKARIRAWRQYPTYPTTTSFPYTCHHQHTTIILKLEVVHWEPFGNLANSQHTTCTSNFLLKVI